MLDDEALQAPSEDGDEGDLDERDEMLLRPLEDGVQPPVAAEPGEGPFDHKDKLFTLIVAGFAGTRASNG